VSAVAATRLAAEGLALSRGGRRLFERLSFELGPGELLLLLGPNGSGKSSLLRALLGLTPLADGRIALGDGAGAADARALCRLALYQGHAGAAKAELTALENLALAAALDGTLEHLDAGASSAALQGALAAVGLERQADLETRRLSQGQRQRLQLARFALALGSPRRPLWLMDEPSAALDTDGASMLASLLQGHLDRGGSAIVATHLPIAPEGARTRTLHVDTFRPRRAGRAMTEAAGAAAIR
jgi:heme exporter protein A